MKFFHQSKRLKKTVWFKNEPMKKQLKRQPIQTHVMIIAHGQSELVICNSIGSNLRIKQHCIARDRGKTSIQVGGLRNFLNSDRRFADPNGFSNEFDDVCMKKRLPSEFRLFPIMDLDDCPVSMREAYCTKRLFQGHWLDPVITPIFCSPNLEEVMNKIGIPVTKKKDYIQLFPTNHGDDLNLETAIEFADKLETHDCTNLEVYVNYCIEICKKQFT